MTKELVGLGLEYTALEGSRIFADSLAESFPQVKVIHALFEEYAPGREFDNIVLGHVLEHVEDPIAVLQRVRTWLSAEGIVLTAVPNSRLLHRQAAVIMGLLNFEEEMSEKGRHHGHRRVYNPETFRRDFIRAGFQIEVFGGYWIKPISDAQIEEVGPETW